MKAYGGSGDIAPRFLASVLDGDEWSVSGPGRLIAPGTHFIGGWVCPRVGLNAVEKRKNLHCNGFCVTSENRASNSTIINKLLIGKDLV
jgi:hypothetical protein